MDPNNHLNIFEIILPIIKHKLLIILFCGIGLLFCLGYFFINYFKLQGKLQISYNHPQEIGIEKQLFLPDIHLQKINEQKLLFDTFLNAKVNLPITHFQELFSYLKLEINQCLQCTQPSLLIDDRISKENNSNYQPLKGLTITILTNLSNESTKHLLITLFKFLQKRAVTYQKNYYQILQRNHLQQKKILTHQINSLLKTIPQFQTKLPIISKKVQQQIKILQEKLLDLEKQMYLQQNYLSDLNHQKISFLKLENLEIFPNQFFSNQKHIKIIILILLLFLIIGIFAAYLRFFITALSTYPELKNQYQQIKHALKYWKI